MKSVFSFLLFVSTIFLSEKANSQTWDQYGGFAEISFTGGNGFFRTEFDGDQWWLVTPDNNAFLSLGINHFHSNLWKKDYNKSYWENELGGAIGSNNWNNGWYQHAIDITKSVGANSMGYHNEDAILKSRDSFLPYIRQYRPLDISMHQRAEASDYMDVFSTEFKERCDSKANSQVKPFINDKMIIGYAMSDVPVLTDVYARTAGGNAGIPTFAMVLRNLASTAPGKQEYVKTMKTIYSGISEFNNTYNTSYSSWTDLENATNWRKKTDFDNAKEISDNNLFNKICISKYYEVALASFRAVDQNHMFLGDKLNANIRDISELELLVDAVKDYVDVVLFQYYGKDQAQKDIQDLIASIGNKPMINGDGGFGSNDDPQMPNPQTPTAANQSQRAIWFNQYAKDAFSNPNFVGWHVCGVIDSWAASSGTGRQKPGVMNPLGVAHQTVMDTLATLYSKVYKFRMLDAPDPTIPLSVVGYTGNLEYTFWPNPTKGVIHFDTHAYYGISEIMIFDVTGKIAGTFRPNNTQFDLTIDGRPGIYYLKVKSNKETRTFKVIKRL